MKLLLDTHALIWWLTADSRLSSASRSEIKSGANTIWVSAVSAYEVALKHGMGKLPEAHRISENFEAKSPRKVFWRCRSWCAKLRSPAE